MPNIGPSLPPHLVSKRKRSESESSEEGPAPPPAPGTRSRSKSPSSRGLPPRVQGPALPPSTLPDAHSSPPSGQPRRVIGPSLPPAPLDELPPEAPASGSISKLSVEDESSDDDFGPAPPPADGSVAVSGPSWEEVRSAASTEPPPSKTLQREDWMLAPPSNADWAQRIDPTKLKSRKFNTMKGAKAANPGGQSGISGIWTETPEERRKRLEDEVMGTTSSAPAQGKSEDKGRIRKLNEEADKETARRVREYNESHRGSASLLERHRAKAKKSGREEEDDPSKRAFDREKDIAGGTASAMQRREVLNRARDMGSRFEKPRYL